MSDNEIYLLIKHIKSVPWRIVLSHIEDARCLKVKVRCQSRWPRRLRHRSSATHLPRLRVRIPQGAWMSVCCDCCVFSGRGLCDGLITRPEESYRLWCVVVCDVRNLRNQKAIDSDWYQHRRVMMEYFSACLSQCSIFMLSGGSTTRTCRLFTCSDCKETIAVSCVNIQDYS